MEKLKPCPFCGSNVVRKVLTYQGNICTEMTVYCPTCFMDITLSPPEYAPDVYFKDVIENWNRRNELAGELGE